MSGSETPDPFPIKSTPWRKTYTADTPKTPQPNGLQTHEAVSDFERAKMFNFRHENVSDWRQV